jgi:hypothetical protein
LAAILVGSRDHRTQFWKRAIQESFQQSLVEIGSVVSEEKIFFKFHPPFFLINLAGMGPGWVPFKFESDSPALHSRWPLLLKIEISSPGQNCSILSQKVHKFELYQHNDELFNIYYWIFYELQDGADGHNFERGPSKDHFSKVWLRLAQ